VSFDVEPLRSSDIEAHGKGLSLDKDCISSFPQSITVFEVQGKSEVLFCVFVFDLQFVNLCHVGGEHKGSLYSCLYHIAQFK
jgi:hypothetical protein